LNLLTSNTNTNTNTPNTNTNTNTQNQPTHSVLTDELAGKDLYIRSVCFSPDGKYLATGAEDKQIRVSFFSGLIFWSSESFVLWLLVFVDGFFGGSVTGVCPLILVLRCVVSLCKLAATHAYFDYSRTLATFKYGFLFCLSFLLPSITTCQRTN
jgi:WD40 repeat protein